MELTKTKYKKTEVGMIPEDWKVCSIEELARVVGGGTPSTQISEYWNGNIEWFTPTEIGRQKYSFRSQRKITELGLKNSSAQILPIGTILMTTRASIGDLSILLKEACTNQGFQSIVANSENDNEFLYYLLSTLKGSLLKNASGSTFLEISPKKVKSIKTAVPPTFTEQKAIATALSDVDELINKLVKLIAKKKAIKQGAMQQLLTGKTRVKGFEGNGTYKKTDIGLIPEDWFFIKLIDCVDYIHGKAHEQHIDDFGSYVVVNSKFISTNGQVRKFSSVNFCSAKVDDILTVLSDLPNGKALAKCFYVDQNEIYAVNQRVCIWRSKRNAYSKFLYYVLNRNKYFLALNDGVSQTHILNNHIESCKIQLPSSLKEQEAIARVLSDIEDEIKSFENRLNKAQLIKQGMMQELLTGKIRLVL